MKSKPWLYTDIWDNESQFLVWLRGRLRKIWEDYPVRVEFKNEQCVTVTQQMRDQYGLHKLARKAAKCVFCNKWFSKSKLEVDHIVGNKSMKAVADVVDYLDHLLCPKSSLQLTCRPCHRIKSYAEKNNMEFEGARLEKAVIAWMKDHDISQQKALLISAGFIDNEMNNAGNRRNSARKLLLCYS